MLSIIVAKAKNNVIGKDNQLIWHLPDDLKRFKKLTTGHTIIMGRKTFESLGRVLPERKHVILSRNKEFKIDDENVEVINDISEVKQYIDSKEECFVIGGAMIYQLLMPVCDIMYITEIDKEFDGDAFFPEIDMNEWKVTNREFIPKENGNDFEYSYVTYERV